MMQSDPFIVKLLEINPDFEKEIYESFLNANQIEALTGFANTPQWVLLQLLNEPTASWNIDSILRHPNVGTDVIDQFISENKVDKFFEIVFNPMVTKQQLLKISEGTNEAAANWANYFLLKDTQQADLFILAELEKEDYQKNIYVLRTLIRDSKLSNNTIEHLIKDHINKVLDDYNKLNLGSFLMNNQSLSPENRAVLQLMGYKIEEKPAIELPFLPSSRLFPIASSTRIVKTDALLLQHLVDVGHPISVIDERYEFKEVEVNEINLHQLIKAEYLHRVFWTELIGIDGFQLNYHNGYRVQDLFISHATLGKEFSEADFDDGWKIGGVLAGYEDRSWIRTEESLGDLERYAGLLINFSNEFEEILYRESISELYAPTLAFFVSEDSAEEFKEKYGVTVTKTGEQLIMDAAFDEADQEDLDVEAFIDESSPENLSWANLSASKKDQLFRLLEFGRTCTNKRLSDDSRHFLGCMALHPATPTNILVKLQDLGDDLVTATLARR